MIHGAPKYCMQTGERSTQVLNIPRRVSIIPWSPKILHGNCQMFHGGAEYSTESVKRSTEPLNDAWKWWNVSPRY